MKLKNLNYVLAAAAIFSFTSCDKVKEMKSNMPEPVQTIIEKIGFADDSAKDDEKEEIVEIIETPTTPNYETESYGYQAVEEVAPVEYLNLYDLPTGGSINQFKTLSNEYLDNEDISHLSSSELRILRNAIYAMHGYAFQSADLQEYFGQFYDYTPETRSTPNFNSIEQANIRVIQANE